MSKDAVETNEWHAKLPTTAIPAPYVWYELSRESVPSMRVMLTSSCGAQWQPCMASASLPQTFSHERVRTHTCMPPCVHLHCVANAQ